MKLITQSHKFKKGDTPEKIAKKYKHKKFDDIWKHEKNKRLKSKRKTPGSLTPGDQLYIPLTAKEKKEIEGTVTILESLALTEADFYIGMTEVYKRSMYFQYNADEMYKNASSATKTAEDVFTKAAIDIKKYKDSRSVVNHASKLIQQPAVKFVGKNLRDIMKQSLKIQKKLNLKPVDANANAFKITSTQLKKFQSKAFSLLNQASKEADKQTSIVAAILSMDIKKIIELDPVEASDKVQTKLLTASKKMKYLRLVLLAAIAKAKLDAKKNAE